MDECIKEISELGRISSDQDVIQSACISIMTNKANDVYIQLKQVFENGRIAKHQILRDPNLQILLKPYKNMIFNSHSYDATPIFKSAAYQSIRLNYRDSAALAKKKLRYIKPYHSRNYHRHLGNILCTI